MNLIIKYIIAGLIALTIAIFATSAILNLFAPEAPAEKTEPHYDIPETSWLETESGALMLNMESTPVFGFDSKPPCDRGIYRDENGEWKADIRYPDGDCVTWTFVPPKGVEICTMFIDLDDSLNILFRGELIWMGIDSSSDATSEESTDME